MPTADDQHELLFGACPLIPADPSDLPYEINATAEGSSFGNPEPQIVEIRSMLLDGSLARILNYGNRSISIMVEISGPDLDAVAVGEAALMVEVNRGRNTLTWTPPDSLAAPTVFDIVWSHPDFTFDDLSERRCVRTFGITLAASPFARDVEETVVEAITTGEAPPTPSTATVDDCTSVTGWALATSPGTSVDYVITGPSVSSGAVFGQITSAPNVIAETDFTIALTRSGLSADLTTTPYLIVQLERGGTKKVSSTLLLKVNGVSKSSLAQVGDRYWVDCSDITTLTSVEVSAVFPVRGSTAPLCWLTVSDISRTNVPPFIGTGRQQFRQFTVGGSARTTGSILVQHETDALGEVLLFTNADDGSGNQPPCRQYRVDGGTPTSDATTASGARSPLNDATAETYDIPAGALPAGVYQVVARLRGISYTGFAIATFRAYTRIGTNNLGMVGNTFDQSVVYVDDTDWGLSAIGAVTLPPVAVPHGSDAYVRVTMASGNPIEIDDLWLFNLSTGALTQVDCGTGTPEAGGSSNRLWIDTASLDWPRPSIWLGTLPDKDDARHALGTECTPGTHLLPPGKVNVFSYTDALNAAVSLRHHRRHHSNATQSDA